MAIETSSYGLRVKTRKGFEEALAATREALKEQGFGVLTEIDVRETLKQKIGADFRPYVILGACNPQMAHQALEVEPEIGLLLPCNVIVYATDEGSIVAAMDPVSTMQALVRNPRLPNIAKRVRARIEAALQAIAAE